MHFGLGTDCTPLFAQDHCLVDAEYSGHPHADYSGNPLCLLKLTLFVSSCLPSRILTVIMRIRKGLIVSHPEIIALTIDTQIRMSVIKDVLVVFIVSISAYVKTCFLIWIHISILTFSIISLISICSKKGYPLEARITLSRVTSRAPK